MRDLRLRAMLGQWYAGVDFLLATPTHYGEVVMREYKELGMISESTFRLSLDQAQTLMDDLWHCGIRPTDGTGSTGQLKATQDHLNDMQKIAFDLIGRKTK